VTLCCVLFALQVLMGLILGSLFWQSPYSPQGVEQGGLLLAFALALLYLHVHGGAAHLPGRATDLHPGDLPGGLPHHLLRHRRCARREPSHRRGARGTATGASDPASTSVAGSKHAHAWPPQTQQRRVPSACAFSLFRGCRRCGVPPLPLRPGHALLLGVLLHGWAWPCAAPAPSPSRPPPPWPSAASQRVCVLLLCVCAPRGRGADAGDSCQCLLFLFWGSHQPVTLPGPGSCQLLRAILCRLGA